MQIEQIDKAVNNFCFDIQQVTKLKKWTFMTEKELTTELLNSILGSNVKYEMSITYANIISDYITSQNISNSGYMDISSNILQLLSAKACNPIVGKSFNKYRFPNIATNNIVRTLKNISDKYGLINNMINKFTDFKQLRQEMINICYGIGPKQASHFLKNVGYTCDVAIIDSHILKYLRMNSITIPNSYNISSIKNYELLENIFLSNVCKKFSFPVSIVDQSIWFIMRNI